MAKQLDKKFIGDDQVDSTKILLQSGQAIRAKDSSGVEQDLIKLGASDEVLVKGQEVALDADLSQEIADRISADNALDSRLDIAEGTLSTHSSQISTLQSDVSAETASRISADANLQSQIDAISGGGSGSLSALQSELDATQVGAGLGTNGAYSAPVASNYLASAVSLKDADDKLDAQIKVVADAVDSNYQSLDSYISSVEDLLAQEVSDREAADVQAVSDANAYTDTQIGNVTTLVDNEVGALQDQINNIVSNVDPAALDSLTEVVAAFQAADASLNGAITALSTGLSQDISDEASARAAADVVLQNNIDAEAAARVAGDNALDARVDVLEAVVWVKEKFPISNGQTSVTLSFTPKANSVSAWVDRLAMHEGAGEDYTLSGTTMSILNPGNGNGQIGSGDTVYVKYQK